MDRLADQAVRPAGSGFDAYRGAIRRQWPVVLITMAAALAATLAYAVLRSPEYKATATLIASPLPATNESFIGIDVLRESADGTRTMQTAAAVLDTREAAVRTAAKLGGGSSTDIERRVSVAPEGQTNLIDVTATAGSAAAAARLANAYVEQILALRRERLTQQAAAVIDDVRRQLRELPSGSNAASVLQARLPQLAAVRLGTDPTLSLGQSASPPASHSGTPAAVLVLIALILGFLAGTGVAVWADGRRRGGTGAELLTVYPLPVLAHVPALARRERSRPRGVPVPSPQAAEAYRSVLTQLHRRKRSTLLVTSAGKDDGKTNVAIGLARVAAEGGLRVALLDLDLRQPAIGDLLHLADIDRSDAAHLRPGKAQVIDLPESPGLGVMAFRDEPLTSLRLETALSNAGAVIDEVAADAELVIVDTAPLGEVSDALRLADHVDHVVVVARPDWTSLAAFARMRDLLERAGHRAAGVVIVGDQADLGYGLPVNVAPLSFERSPGEATASR